MKFDYLLIFFVFLFPKCSNSNYEIKKEYYPNGNIKLVAECKDSIPHGEYREYYKNGKLKSQQYYILGSRDSLCKWFYSNGIKSKIINYKNGQMYGEYISYYDNGNVRKMYYFKNGVKDSIAKKYFKNGALKTYILYDMGTVNFYEKYDSMGNLVSNFRKVKIEPMKDTVNLGELYKSIITLQGPIEDRYNIIYSATSPQRIKKDNTKNKEVHAYPLKKDKNKGIYLCEANDTGMFVYFGRIKLYYDSSGFPKFYDFQDTLYVEKALVHKSP